MLICMSDPDREKRASQPGEPRYVKVLMHSSSDDGRTCDFWDEDGERCGAPSVGRSPYQLWRPPGVVVPKGVPDPATLWVGACEAHFDTLVRVSAPRGGTPERF
jgi:hypothetical protein